MAIDAWLPIGFSLPDGQRVGAIINASQDWQILSTDKKQRTLIVKPSLSDRWIQSKLLQAGTMQSFSFGASKFASLASDNSHELACLNNCKSPGSKAEAMAFAAALKETRAIDSVSSLHDALYIEKLTRLLPTCSTDSKIADDIVLGTWLGGGLNVSVFPLRRIQKILSWLSLDGLYDVVERAGFEIGDLVKSGGVVEKQQGRGARKYSDATEGAGKKQFSLPGRVILEKFFNEHVIEIIQNRELYKKLGIEFPPAIVLEGPPGCGKTFAVEQLVEFLGWPLYSVDSASVASPYIHETSKKVSQVFEQAMENAPSVVVIDEMEAFLADRNAGAGSSHHRVEEVAEFLRRIPQAIKKGVLIIGMTNRLDMIDEAILRRGRFDQIIKVDYAGEDEVVSLLGSLLRDLPKTDDIDIVSLARKLAGRPLSDVSYVVREGARLAARARISSIDNESLAKALASTPARDVDASPRRIGFT